MALYLTLMLALDIDILGRVPQLPSSFEYENDDQHEHDSLVAASLHRALRALW